MLLASFESLPLESSPANSASQTTYTEKQFNKDPPAPDLTRYLPLELLGETFLFCVDSGWGKAPHVLRKVCSVWRKVVLSLAAVWSRIQLNAEDRDITWFLYQLVNVQSVPLHIELFESLKFHKAHIIGLLLLLLRDTLWSSLKIAVPHPLSPDLSTIAKHSCGFPLLRSVEVEVDWFVSERRSEEVLDLAGTFTSERAPLLRVISLECYAPVPLVNFPVTLTTLNLNVHGRGHAWYTPVKTKAILDAILPLTQLQHLTLATSVPCLDSHMSANSERSLGLVDYDTKFESLEDDVMFILPSLTNLSLQLPPGSLAMIILSHLLVPGLRILRVRSHMEETCTTVIGPPLRQFLQHSSKLESMSIFHCKVSAEVYVSALPKLRSLQELRLHHDCAMRAAHSKAILDMLHTQCLKLTILELVSWEVSSEDLLRLVQGRSHGGASPITMLRLVCCGVEADDILSLAKLTRCKLNVDMEHMRAYGVSFMSMYMGIVLVCPQYTRGRLLLPVIVL